MKINKKHLIILKKKFAATSPLVNQLTYFQKMASTRINNYFFDEHQDKLGEGQYGRVYRVRDVRMHGKTYALKLLQRSKFTK